MLKFSFYNSFIKFIQKQNEKKKQNVSKNMPRHFFYSNSNSNNVDLQTQHETCPHSELFWSAFSRIRTKYGEKRISRNAGKCGPE